MAKKITFIFQYLHVKVKTWSTSSFCQIQIKFELIHIKFDSLNRPATRHRNPEASRDSWSMSVQGKEKGTFVEGSVQVFSAEKK
jgi:hypothetical protein